MNKQLQKLLQDEYNRQQNTIELIASENITSKAVMQACGSVLTNKYAEGKPYKRFYCGCEFIDQVETLAIDLCKKLFGCEHANVQPHSGAQANMAVFLATLKPYDTILGMDLSNGGHLTHGSPVNFSGMYFNVCSYGITTDGIIDYDKVRSLAKVNKPKLIIAGASNYSKIIDFQKFRDIADEVGAYLLVDMAHIAGLVAGGAHPSPIPYADFVTTTTHKTLRGPRGGIIMCKQCYADIIDKAVFPGTQGGPLEHIIAGKAQALYEATLPEFTEYAHNVVANAKELCNQLISMGVKIVGGCTENHLFTIDLTGMELTGKELADKLEEVGITCNKNTVPNDTRSPFITSGVRIGTPAITTRGFQKSDMQTIAYVITQVIQGDYDSNALKRICKDLCKKYPLYRD